MVLADALIGVEPEAHHIRDQRVQPGLLYEQIRPSAGARSGNQLEDSIVNDWNVTERWARLPRAGLLFLTR